MASHSSTMPGCLCINSSYIISGYFAESDGPHNFQMCSVTFPVTQQEMFF